jgi:hypothetical protein
LHKTKEFQSSVAEKLSQTQKEEDAMKIMKNENLHTFVHQ